MPTYGRERRAHGSSGAPELAIVGTQSFDRPPPPHHAGETLGFPLEREAEMAELGLTAAFFRAGPVMIEAIELVTPNSPFRPLESGAKARIDHIARTVRTAKRRLFSPAPKSARPHARLEASARPTASTGELPPARPTARA